MKAPGLLAHWAFLHPCSAELVAGDLLLLCSEPSRAAKKPCYPLTALCSGAPVLLLNSVLFSISIIHNSYAVASNIEQRDGAERSGGGLLVFHKPSFFSPLFANNQIIASSPCWKQK